VEARDPGVRELSRLSIFDDDAPALLYMRIPHMHGNFVFIYFIYLFISMTEHIHLQCNITAGQQGTNK